MTGARQPVTGSHLEDDSFRRSGTNTLIGHDSIPTNSILIRKSSPCTKPVCRGNDPPALCTRLPEGPRFPYPCQLGWKLRVVATNLVAEQYDRTGVGNRTRGPKRLPVRVLSGDVVRREQGTGIPAKEEAAVKVWWVMAESTLQNPGGSFLVSNIAPKSQIDAAPTGPQSSRLFSRYGLSTTVGGPFERSVLDLGLVNLQQR